jgi:hypothetical protein
VYLRHHALAVSTPERGRVALCASLSRTSRRDFDSRMRKRAKYATKEERHSETQLLVVRLLELFSFDCHLSKLHLVYESYIYIINRCLGTLIHVDQGFKNVIT